MDKITDINKLEALYLGAFFFYLDYCQYQAEQQVTIFCDSLVEDFDKLPFKTQERLKLKLKVAWKQELDYGKNNFLSPFGRNQEAWYKVVEKVLGK